MAIVGVVGSTSVASTYTGHSSKSVSMLAHRLRSWSNIETALCECPVFAGLGWNNCAECARVQSDQGISTRPL